MPQRSCGDSAAFARWQPLGRSDYLHHMARPGWPATFPPILPMNARQDKQSNLPFEIGHHLSFLGRIGLAAVVHDMQVAFASVDSVNVHLKIHDELTVTNPAEPKRGPSASRTTVLSGGAAESATRNAARTASTPPRSPAPSHWSSETRLNGGSGPSQDRAIWM